MKAAELKQFGIPEQSVECIDIAEPDQPAADEVIIDLEACPINPAELLLIQGKYASRPPLPARLGIEGVGVVTALGSAVDDLQPGERVMSLSRNNWVQRCRLKRQEVIKLPADIDVQQAAMLKVNPATAYSMLKNYVNLQAGDWVVQNAANSGVGTGVIQLARTLGVHTINVVRRESLIAPLKALGADVVIVDGDDLGARVRAELGAEIGADKPVKLAIDAVAGAACMRLADCLSDEGVVVNYGLLSGDPCMITAEQTVFRGISLTGFWLAKTMRSMDHQTLQTLYTELAGKIVDQTLHTAVEAVYPLDQVQTALAHANREGRDGKILLAPNH